jgi:hypothetical protein
LSNISRNTLPAALERLVWLFFCVAAIALTRTGASGGHDLEVLWRAAKSVWEGGVVYADPSGSPMVFKYPPWIATLLVPLGWIPLDLLKWIWGPFQILCLALVGFLLRRHGMGRVSIYATLIVFWGIWAVNAIDGQVNLPILAFVVLAYGSRSIWVKGIGLLALSTKVFHFPAAIGFVGRRDFRSVVVAAVFAVLLSLPLLSPALLTEWLNAAGSGGVAFPENFVRGHVNQGLPALVLRTLGVSSLATQADLFVYLGLSLIIWPAFVLWAAKRLDPFQGFAAGLGLATALHPLAWFHTFALSFPLVACVIDATWKRPRSRAAVVGLFGVVLVCVVTQKTLGELGLFLENCSVKSLGVLVCVGYLLFVSKR